ncbi:hypothetical protein IOCL2690_000119800 [Leishmania lindenbergi]|uniref:Uncharacterized protein n=1 Tax=Leishmania lindenbergi TaxID=651832 RepID=A0AAW3AWH7_9TRYP
MSRFAEYLVGIAWGYSKYTIEAFNNISRSLVKDDEYILMFLIFLCIPAVLIMWAIARCIRRSHNRVRYASEYRGADSSDYATSSSNSSNNSRSSDDDAAHHGNRRSGRRPTIEEVVQAAQQLTEQETMRRRRNRRLAARYGCGGDASAKVAPDGETEGKE